MPPIFTLVITCPATFPVYDSRIDLLANITENTVAINISFARYTKSTYQYASLLKKRGAKLISFTDTVFQILICSMNEYPSGENVTVLSEYTQGGDIFVFLYKYFRLNSTYPPKMTGGKKKMATRIDRRKATC